MPNTKNKVIIGIDLGTTYSCVAAFQNGKPAIIHNEQGRYTTPSCAAIADNEVLSGDAAIAQLPVNPENTIYDVKRLIGRQFNDENVKENLKIWPFTVKEGYNDRAEIELTFKGIKKRIPPEIVSSIILKRMKQIAEDFLDQEVNDAVLTVPAYFNDSQRRATKDAGLLAGLNIVKIINEPTAAAIAYGLYKMDEVKTNLLVYDLGGGTFDVTILTIESGIFDVISTTGDAHLGGQDFTNRLVDRCVEDIKKQTNRDVTRNKIAMIFLRRSCEEAKKLLSFQKKADVILKHGIWNYHAVVSRALFEDINLDLFTSTLKHVRGALKNAKMEIQDVDKIILVGGSTRIPKIQELLKSFAGDNKVNKCLNPDEGVALGAAIQAEMLTENSFNTNLSNITLFDVTPMTLGIAMSGSKMCRLIPKNSKMPLFHTEEFKTVHDNQDSIMISVYEGENDDIEGNNLLGEFKLENIPLEPKGAVKIDVTFDIDVNGILTVSAVEKSRRTSRKSITINNTSGHFTNEDIATMKRDVFTLMSN